MSQDGPCDGLVFLWSRYGRSSERISLTTLHGRRGGLVSDVDSSANQHGDHQSGIEQPG